MRILKDDKKLEELLEDNVQAPTEQDKVEGEKLAAKINLGSSNIKIDNEDTAEKILANNNQSIEDAKKKAIDTIVGEEDASKDLTDDDVDNVLGTIAKNIKEKKSIYDLTEEVISCMKEVKASDLDIAEALHVNVGYSLREAKEVMKDFID